MGGARSSGGGRTRCLGPRADEPVEHGRGDAELDGVATDDVGAAVRGGGRPLALDLVEAGGRDGRAAGHGSGGLGGEGGPRRLEEGPEELGVALGHDLLAADHPVEALIAHVLLGREVLPRLAGQRERRVDLALLGGGQEVPFPNGRHGNG